MLEQSTNHLINSSQKRLERQLKLDHDFNISFKDTEKIMKRFVGTKVNLAILNIDLIGSTKMSLDLPIDKLTTIIRSFAQEMSIIISSYGGYVLKYVGDAVLAFFVFDDKVNEDMSYVEENRTSNHSVVIECANTMINVIQKEMNPILIKYDYPELKVRVGIDYGEIAVVRYGIDIEELADRTTKRLHLDMVGYTISIAVKMTSLAKPNRIVIGQALYDEIDNNQKKRFREIPTEQDIWKYVRESTGKNYFLYENIL